MNIANAEVFRYRLSLKAPVTLKPGTVINAREGLLLRLRGEDGAEAWGEAAPLPGFSLETLDVAQAALVQCAQNLSGQPFPEQIEEYQARNMMPALAWPSVSFAVESAALGLRAAQAGLPLWRSISADPPGTLPVCALLTGPPKTVTAQAEQIRKTDCRAVKLKVGRDDLAAEVEMVHAVRAALGSEIELRLDANRAWDFETAAAFGKQVADCDIAFIEEPLEDAWQCPRFSQETGIPFALDETLHQPGALGGASGAEALYRLCQQAGAVVLKPSLVHLPGLASLLATAGFPVKRLVFSAAFESGVGIAVLAQYAAAFGTPGVAAGLDTYGFLAEDVLETPLPIAPGPVHLETVAAAAQRVHHARLIPAGPEQAVE